MNDFSFNIDNCYSWLFEHAAEAIFICDDAKMAIHDANQSAADISGCSAEELQGKRLAEFIPSADYERYISTFLEIGAETAPSSDTRSFESRFNAAGGKKIPVQITLKHGSDTEAGNNGFVLVWARDITNEKQLQRQYQCAQKMELLAHLAGGVAHDFNNIMTAIIGYADLALISVGPDEDANEDLRELVKTAKRAIRLISQLQAFSRQRPAVPQPINPGEELVEMNSMLQRLIGDNIELSTEAEKDIWHINIDPSQFEQILINMIINARDALPDGGVVKVTAENRRFSGENDPRQANIPPGDYVMFTVHDNGIGMSGEVASRIFEPFYTTKEEGKGTGLGLSTCYGIVKQNKGVIWVESEEYRGTSFVFCIPRYVVAESNSQKVADTHVSKSLAGGSESILVVEDEDGVRILMSRILRNLGYSVTAVENGERALAEFNTGGEKFDLIITDVIMPRLNGSDLANRILAKKPGTKILFISGYTGELLLRHGIDDRETQILKKPFSAEIIAGRVRAILDE